MSNPVVDHESVKLNVMTHECPQCDQSLEIDLVGLTAITDVVCPVCGCTYRFPLSHIRRYHKRLEKAARTIRASSLSPSVIERANVAEASVMTAKGKPLPVARVTALDGD